MNEETYHFMSWLQDNLKEGMIEYRERHEQWLIDDVEVEPETVVDNYFNNPFFTSSLLKP